MVPAKNLISSRKPHSRGIKFIYLLLYICVANQNLSLLHCVRQVEKVDESYRKFLEKLLDEKFYNRRIRPFYSDNPGEAFIHKYYSDGSVFHRSSVP